VAKTGKKNRATSAPKRRNPENYWDKYPTQDARRKIVKHV
jgi:hypothetical protein